MYAGDLAAGGSLARAWSDSLLVDHAVFRVLWDNFAEVVPGKLYRSNHPTPARLAAAARKLGLRTLINLRGHRQCGSDALSRDAARRLGCIISTWLSRAGAHRTATASSGSRTFTRSSKRRRSCIASPVPIGPASRRDWPCCSRAERLPRRWDSSPGGSATSSFTHRYSRRVLHHLCKAGRGATKLPGMGAGRLR